MSRPPEHESLSLSDAASMLLDECRMVLPGIQALFGFQLVVVFENAFFEKLGPQQLRIHLVAMTLVATAIAIIMTPAAYHRQKGALDMTRLFIDVSTRLLLWSMVPLSAGISLDFYLVAQALVPSPAAAFLAAALFAVYLLLWFVLPRSRRLQTLVERGR